MKKDIFWFFAIIFCFCACKNRSRDYRSYKYKLNKLSNITFQNVSEYYSIDGCSREEAHCAYVLVEYPSSDLEKFKDALKLNDQIKAEVLELLRPVSTNIHEDNIGVISNNFLDRYRTFEKEFPESSHSWYIRLIGDVTWQSNEFLTVRFSYNDYTGSAHPNHALFYKVYDKKRGRVAVLADIVTDVGELRKLAEIKFRKLKQIGQTLPWTKQNSALPRIPSN